MYARRVKNIITHQQIYVNVKKTTHTCMRGTLDA